MHAGKPKPRVVVRQAPQVARRAHAGSTVPSAAHQNFPDLACHNTPGLARAAPPESAPAPGLGRTGRTRPSGPPQPRGWGGQPAPPPSAPGCYPGVGLVGGFEPHRNLVSWLAQLLTLCGEVYRCTGYTCTSPHRQVSKLLMSKLRLHKSQVS